MPTDPFGTALALIASGDPGLMEIIRLSLAVTLSAAAHRLPDRPAARRGAGAAPLSRPRRGRRGAQRADGPAAGGGGARRSICCCRAPGRSGRSGCSSRPPAMVLAQDGAGPADRGLADPQRRRGSLGRIRASSSRSLGSSPLRAVPTLLWDGRFSLLTGVLAGFGRASAEVGAVLIVGGNIAGHTRTMTTAIALETSRGDLALALGARDHPARASRWR